MYLEPENSRPAATAWKGAWLAAAALLLSVTVAGCYDGEQLVEMAHAEAIRSRMDEVNLGTYRTTLPKGTITAGITEIEFRIFGNAPRYLIPKITAELETEAYRVRFATITAVRQASGEEFAEPDFATLRARLLRVANEIFAEEPIESVGIADIWIVQR